MKSFQESCSGASFERKNEINHGQRIGNKADDIWKWTLPTGPIRASRRAALLIQQGQINSGKTVLELGCGTGIITEQLAHSGAKIVAIDLSPKLLEIAQKRRIPANVVFKIGNAESLNFQTKTFDVVVGSSILHHLNLNRVLSEVHRVLRPCGSMAFSEPNMLNPQILIQKNVPWIKHLVGDTPSETAFFKWKISNKLLQAGFKEVKSIPYDFLHPYIPLSFIRPFTHLGRIFESTPLIREIAGSLIISAIRPNTH